MNKDKENRIMLFEQFVQKLNEAEGDETDFVADATGDEDETEGETGGGTDAETNAEEEVKDKEFLPRLSPVVEKEFFKELKEHIIYWFMYDKTFQNYELDSAEEETRAVVAWAFDTYDEEKGETEPEFTYKIKYAEADTVGDIEKVEEVILIIHIYKYSDSSQLLKQTEMKITLENINADFLKDTIDSLKKRILKVPQSEDDVDDFKKKQKRRLGDNMY